MRAFIALRSAMVRQCFTLILFAFSTIGAFVVPVSVQAADSPTLTTIQRVTKLRNLAVKNHKQERLALVEDIVFFLNEERIDYMLLKAASPAGVEKKYVAVPVAAVRFNATQNCFVMDADKNLLLSAVAASASVRAQQKPGTEIHEAAGAMPSAKENTSGANVAIKANELIGASVGTIERQRVGVIRDIAVNISTGRILYIVVGIGGFLGFGENLYAIPARAISHDDIKDFFTVGFSKSSLRRCRIDSDHWPEHAINLQNPLEKDTTGTIVAASPFDQSNKPEDIEITRRIRQGLGANPNLSTGARNIMIVTRDKAVFLRGTVANAEEKQLVEEIAEHVSGTLVSSELQTPNFKEAK